MKYILTKENEVVIFSEMLSHAETAMRLLEHRFYGEWRELVIGAGFVDFSTCDEDEEVLARCYGESVSLGVKSRVDKDEEVINRQLNSTY